MTEDTCNHEQHDHAHNDLETHLFEMWEGKMSKEDFLRVFLMSDLFIVVDGEPLGNTLGDRKPMVISAAIDQPKMIAVFSSPERASRMTAQFPDYNFPIRVDTNWVLHCIGPSMGVAFNPGWEMGFEIAPDGAQQLRDALDSAISQAGEV
jgi:hypothetical protein